MLTNPKTLLSPKYFHHQGNLLPVENAHIFWAFLAPDVERKEQKFYHIGFFLLSAFWYSKIITFTHTTRTI